MPITQVGFLPRSGNPASSLSLPLMSLRAFSILYLKHSTKNWQPCPPPSLFNWWAWRYFSFLPRCGKPVQSLFLIGACPCLNFPRPGKPALYLTVQPICILAIYTVAFFQGLATLFFLLGALCALHSPGNPVLSPWCTMCIAQSWQPCSFSLVYHVHCTVLATLFFLLGVLCALHSWLKFVEEEGAEASLPILPLLASYVLLLLPPI